MFCKPFRVLVSVVYMAPVVLQKEHCFTGSQQCRDDIPEFPVAVTCCRVVRLQVNVESRVADLQVSY